MITTKFFLATILMGGAPSFAHSPVDDSFQEAPVVLDDAHGELRGAAARERAEKMALAGDYEAASALSDYYLQGAGNDRSQGIFWLRKYTEARNGEAPLALAQVLIEGGSQDEIIEGRLILEERSDSGDIESTIVLAEHCLSKGDSECSLFYFQRASLQGDPRAMVRLADIYEGAQSRPAKALAASWLLTASLHFDAGTYRNRQLVERAEALVNKLREEEVDAIKAFSKVLESKMED